MPCRAIRSPHLFALAAMFSRSGCCNGRRAAAGRKGAARTEFEVKPQLTLFMPVKLDRGAMRARAQKHGRRRAPEISRPSSGRTDLWNCRPARESFQQARWCRIKLVAVAVHSSLASPLTAHENSPTSQLPRLLSIRAIRWAGRCTTCAFRSWIAATSAARTACRGRPSMITIVF